MSDVATVAWLKMRISTFWISFLENEKFSKCSGNIHNWPKILSFEFYDLTVKSCSKWVPSLWNFGNFHLNFIFNLNLMSLAKWLCESLFQSLFSMNLKCLPDDSPRDFLHIIWITRARKLLEKIYSISYSPFHIIWSIIVGAIILES